jgi:hypothetical protein
MAIRSAGPRLLGDAEGESRRSPSGGRTRHAHEWHHRPAATRLVSKPPSARSPVATSFRPAKCPSCSGSRARRSITSRAAASSRRGVSDDAGSFSATASPPRSRRWTNPAPGARRTMTSGAATAIGDSRSPARYSKALLRRAGRAATKRSEAPKPQRLQALQEAGATGLEPAASGVTDRLADPKARGIRPSWSLQAQVV